jgi:pyruvate ferredoxin oxidoreductase gamma subunit
MHPGGLRSWHAIGTEVVLAMVRHVRFHGRGGEGVKLASRIVSRAGFLMGFTVQDSPVYGAERRGAPVVAFARFGRGPILERGYIDHADAVVVMDASLFAYPESAVLAGVGPDSLLMVNSPRAGDELQLRHRIAGRVVSLDVSSLALEIVGRHVLSAPIAGLVVKVTRLAPWEILAAALEAELQAAGVTGALLERNAVATRKAYDAAPAIGFGALAAPPPARRWAPSGARPFTLPRLPARIAAPSIGEPATSALRTTEGWRVYRPVIDRERCSRCILCFALCPDGAIALDADNYPVVDYHHCKGCLVCVEECPPQAIDRVREEAA